MMCSFTIYIFLYLFLVFFFLMIRRPPRSTRTDTLFPLPSLFRSHAHEIEALQLGLACDDKALPSDDRFDIRACPGDYRVALIGPVVSAETTKHRFDIDSRRVAQRAGDEGAISIARGRAARGSGQRIAQPFMQVGRSEEHTSELQSLMRNSYAVFCLKKKKQHIHDKTQQQTTT